MSMLHYIFSGLLLAGSPAPHTPEKPGTIFFSGDSGDNWARADSGLPADVTISAWTVLDDVVVAGTAQHGLYVSYDKLKTWHASRRGLPADVQIKAFATQGSLLFAGTYLRGVYISADAGRTWQQSSAGLGQISVRCLYVQNGTLYAGTDTGIYGSYDEGRSWKIITRGMQVNAFTSSKGSLYAATNRGVLRSEDGVRWSWSWKEKTLFTITAVGGVIASVTPWGEVYICQTDNGPWVMFDSTFKQYTFNLTPASRPLLVAQWKDTFRSLRERGTFAGNGLPDELSFSQILVTPFGVLVAMGAGGC